MYIIKLSSTFSFLNSDKTMHCLKPVNAANAFVSGFVAKTAVNSKLLNINRQKRSIYIDVKTKKKKTRAVKEKKYMLNV